jgi:hypothetical protein
MIADHEFADIMIQNLSANNVYVTSDRTQGTADGLKIAPAGNYTNDRRFSSVWLVADGALSDVRVYYHLYLDLNIIKVTE